MAENSLLKKLEGLEFKFQEISTLITDPSVISDQKRYVKLNREYRELEKVLKALEGYKKLLAGIDEAKEVMASSDDADLKEMAREELAELVDPRRFVGRAPEQVEDFLAEVISPILEANKDSMDVKAEVNV